MPKPPSSHLDLSQQFLSILQPLVFVGFIFAALTHLPAVAAESGIRWIQANPETALAQARNAGKPVLLYWGAAWCPPCNQLKATVFKSPAFIEKTHHFVSIYLDGDKEDAQLIGERFKVMGYPTLILMDANGQEITRIPGGLNLDQYPEVLDLALKKTLPAAAIINKLMDGSSALSGDEIRLLAHYSWDQDSGQALGGRDLMSVLDKLSKTTPSDMTAERGNIESAYLAAFSALSSEKKSQYQDDVSKRMSALLLAPDKITTNLGFLTHEAADVISAIGRNDPEAQLALALLLENSLRNQLKPEPDATSRLHLMAGISEALRLQGKEVSDELKAQIRSDVQLARDASKQDVPTQVTATYTAFNALQESGQQEEAQSLMQQALTEETNSAYWMLILAEIAEQQQQPTEALLWYKQSYEITVGAASKLQWGSYYLKTLIHALPNEDEQIRKLAMQLAAEASAQPHGFHGRNAAALQRMATAIKDWSSLDAQNSLYQDFRAQVEKSCVAQEPGAKGHAHCMSLLEIKTQG